MIGGGAKARLLIVRDCKQAQQRTKHTCFVIACRCCDGYI